MGGPAPYTVISLICMGHSKKIPPCSPKREPQASVPLCLLSPDLYPSWPSSLPNGSAHHSDLATLEGPRVSFPRVPDPFSYSVPLHLSSRLTGKHPLEPTPTGCECGSQRIWIPEDGMPKACPDMKQAFYSLNLLSHLESEISPLG